MKHVFTGTTEIWFPFDSGEHHPTDYLAKRIEKESKIGLQLGTLGGGNHFLEVVYSEGDGQALSICLNLNVCLEV